MKTISINQKNNVVLHYDESQITEDEIRNESANYSWLKLPRTKRDKTRFYTGANIGGGKLLQRLRVEASMRRWKNETLVLLHGDVLAPVMSETEQVWKNSMDMVCEMIKLATGTKVVNDNRYNPSQKFANTEEGKRACPNFVARAAKLAISYLT